MSGFPDLISQKVMGPTSMYPVKIISPLLTNKHGLSMEEIASSDKIQEAANELLSKQSDSTRYPGMYVIYDVDVDRCLWFSDGAEASGETR
jgi:hypothetical protein